MSYAFLYWFFMLLWVLFGCWFGLRPNGDRFGLGFTGIGFLLFLVLGLKVFGFPVHG